MSRLMKDIREAFASFKDHYEGKITLRTSEVPRPKPIKMPGKRVRGIRSRLHMSQEVFARCIHTSRRTLEKWEQDEAKPTGAAAALLALVDRHPEIVGELVGAG
jgi:putative transcriptional regulator